jgi:hypothetical protein
MKIKNNNSSNKIPFSSFFMMMASLAHHNKSQFLTFENKIALRQNKLQWTLDRFSRGWRKQTMNAGKQLIRETITQCK